MKKPLKIRLIILAVLVGLVAALLIWLTATQLNVKTETAVVTNGENSTASSRSAMRGPRSADTRPRFSAAGRRSTPRLS